MIEPLAEENVILSSRREAAMILQGGCGEEAVVERRCFSFSYY
jgi:hypothetical protein